MNNYNKISILYTGGTIGMIGTNNGLASDSNLPEKVASLLEKYKWHNQISWSIEEQLIDSSCITPQHWLNWQNKITQLFENYDKVIVLHGTDTMAYSAALFNILFTNQDKSLIFTGSQKTWDEKNSDASHNLLCAILATGINFRGTGIVFANHLFNPADCRKISTINNNGFAAIFKQPYAEYTKGQWQFLSKIEKPTIPKKFQILNPNLRIASAYLMPGFSLDIISEILEENKCDAMILQSFGNGNVPDNKRFINAVKNFCNQGKIILNISQNLHGEASTRYAQNQTISNAGAINGGFLTPENALAKLNIALSAQMSVEEMREYLPNRVLQNNDSL